MKKAIMYLVILAIVAVGVNAEASCEGTTKCNYLNLIAPSDPATCISIGCAWNPIQQCYDPLGANNDYPCTNLDQSYCELFPLYYPLTCEWVEPPPVVPKTKTIWSALGNSGKFKFKMANNGHTKLTFRTLS